MGNVESEITAAATRSAELYNNGDLLGAIAVWDTVVQVYPDSTTLFARAALRVLVPELHADAVKDFAGAVSKAPNNADRANLAISAGSKCEEAGLFDAAIKFYGTGIEAEPKNAVCYYYRGLAYSHAGFPQPSADDFSSAIELNGSDGFAYLRRAVSNSEMGQMDEAFSDLNAATRFKDSFSSRPDIVQLLNTAHVAFGIQFADRDLEMALSALEVVVPTANDDEILAIFKVLFDNIEDEQSRKIATTVVNGIGKYSEETVEAINSLADQAGLDIA